MNIYYEYFFVIQGFKSSRVPFKCEVRVASKISMLVIASFIVEADSSYKILEVEKKISEIL